MVEINYKREAAQRNANKALARMPCPCATFEVSKMSENCHCDWYYWIYFCYFFLQLHAVSRWQQGRQKEPSVRTLFFSFRQNSIGFTCWVPRFVSTPEQRHENIKYLISSSENRTHNLSRLQLNACALAPPLASTDWFRIKNCDKLLQIKQSLLQCHVDWKTDKVIR